MKKKILIVDDNSEDKILIRDLLEGANLGCEIILAQLGKEGIQIVHDESPDIVIVDTVMPHWDGFETCQRIREMKGDNIKVILMTGVLDSINAEKAKQVGADEYCLKTLDGAFLLTAIKNYL